MSWEEQLKQKWATAQDNAARQHLLTIYHEQIAALSEHERENLFAELNELGCHTAHGSETHHMRDERTSNEDGNE